MPLAKIATGLDPAADSHMARAIAKDEWERRRMRENWLTMTPAERDAWIAAIVAWGERERQRIEQRYQDNYPQRPA